jgi:hypothetical protein
MMAAVAQQQQYTNAGPTEGNQQYELANMESQPSFYNAPMEKTLVKHLKGSVGGTYDTGISLQLYGQADTKTSNGPYTT